MHESRVDRIWRVFSNPVTYVLSVCSMIIFLHNTCIWQRGLTVQVGEVTASAWMDCKMVTVMSTNSQPSAAGTVLRKQKDGTHIHVPCPESIISYNRLMGRVDRGDKLRRYCSYRSINRKFCKYIFSSAGRSNDKRIHPHLSLITFTFLQEHQILQTSAGQELIGEYCSRRCRGHGSTVIHPHPFRHYPIRIGDDKPGPRHP